jgi:hypothetical protein
MVGFCCELGGEKGVGEEVVVLWGGRGKGEGKGRGRGEWKGRGRRDKGRRGNNGKEMDIEAALVSFGATSLRLLGEVE